MAKSVILLTALLLSLPAFADDDYTKLEVNGTANQNIELLSRPPHGLLHLFVGKPVTTINKGKPIRIIEKRTYSGQRVWYKVDQPNSENNQAVGGWVYSGIEGKEQSIQIESVNRGK